MEPSHVGAIRGHDVTLFEEADKLGGMVNLACAPPHKEELRNIADYYSSQMGLLHLRLRPGETSTRETLDEIKPDVVVLASGAREFIPDIPGIEDEQVFSALEVLKDSANVGENVAVVGGGLIGVETAEFLVEKGKKLTIVEMLKSIASDIGPTTRWGLLQRIYKKMAVLTSSKVIGIKNGQVIVKDQENNQKEISADTVEIAAGLSPRADLAPMLEESNTEYHIVGSCRKPGQIGPAIAVGCKV